MRASILPFKARGEVRAPQSKSWLHRALILAAQSPEGTSIPMDPPCGDVRRTLTGLTALGAEVTESPDGIRIRKHRLGSIPGAKVDCGESASTARFLLPLAASLRGAGFTGSGRLPQRPLSHLCGAIRDHGARVSGDRLPLTVDGGMAGGGFDLPGDVSSQYISGLILSAPSREEDTLIRLTGPLESAPYVDLTARMMGECGIPVSRSGDTVLVPGGRVPHPPDPWVPEGDWSAAACLLIFGALSGPVRVTGLDGASAQGDRRILDLLERAGAFVRRYPDGALVRRGDLKPLNASVRDIPDSFTALAALCAFIPGESRLEGAGRLRLKESDRLAASAAMVVSLGAFARVEGDALVIRGREKLPGGTVDGMGDHRIVMAAAAAASACAGECVITGWEAVSKSYPGFYGDLCALGGNENVIRVRP